MKNRTQYSASIIIAITMFTLNSAHAMNPTSTTPTANDVVKTAKIDRSRETRTNTAQMAAPTGDFNGNGTVDFPDF